MLFLIFVVVTLAEIIVFKMIDISWTSLILLVILTAFIGSNLLRQQGWSTMAKAQKSLSEGRSPAIEMLEGVVILVSGVLLITPGFITDGIGLLGLIPWSRSYFINHFLEKNAERVFRKKNSVFINKGENSETKKTNKDETIEGEFWEDK